jgi:hypothetical protein
MHRLVFLTLLLLPAALRAQSPAVPHPAERVAGEAFAALDAMRFDRAAELVHPRFLAVFHATQLQQARHMERLQARGPEPRREPGMPPEVAAWLEEQQRLHLTHQGGWLEMSFAGVGTLQELESLGAREMLARWLRAHDPRYQIARQAELRGTELPEDACPERILSVRRTIVGSVVEDDSTAQVVYRRAVTDLQREEVAVLTLRRAPEGWRLWDFGSDHGILGSFSFGFALSEEEERAAFRLEAGTRELEWTAEGWSLRAAMEGYGGDGSAPRGLGVEVRRPDGDLERLEIPFAALWPLVEFLHPWLLLEPVSEPR